MNSSFSLEDLKILEFLNTHPDNMFYATELAAELGIPKSTLLYRIDKLVENKYVNQIQKGRMKFYKSSDDEDINFIGNLSKLVTYQYDILERLERLRRSPENIPIEELQSITEKTRSVNETLTKLEKILNEVKNINDMKSREGRQKIVEELFEKMNKAMKG